MGLHYEPKMQKCSCCGEEKVLSEFYKQSITGLPTLQCKVCTNVKRGVVRNKQRHGKFVSKEKQRSGEAVEFTLKEWSECMIHFKGECCYCGKREGRAKADKFDREHFIPLSQGGRAEQHNIGPACSKCNRGRGNKDLFTWFRQQSFWTMEREARIKVWIQWEELNG